MAKVLVVGHEVNVLAGWARAEIIEARRLKLRSMYLEYAELGWFRRIFNDPPDYTWRKLEYVDIRHDEMCAAARIIRVYKQMQQLNSI